MLNLFFFVYRIYFKMCLKIVKYVGQRANVCYLRKKKARFDSTSIRFDGITLLKIDNSAKVEIGDSFRCVSTKWLGIDTSSTSKITVFPNAILKIGRYTGMTNSVINCHLLVEIGSYVNIGAGTMIVDSDFHSLDWHDRRDGVDVQKRVDKPVKIGDYVFIGTRSIILKGVTIGDKSIIGAGSVVSCDIPEGEIWAGNPAMFIKKAPNICNTIKL